MMIIPTRQEAIMLSCIASFSRLSYYRALYGVSVGRDTI